METLFANILAYNQAPFTSINLLQSLNDLLKNNTNSEWIGKKSVLILCKLTCFLECFPKIDIFPFSFLIGHFIRLLVRSAKKRISLLIDKELSR